MFIASLISPWTVCALAFIACALLGGLFVTRAGAANRHYDDESEAAYRDLMARKFAAKKSEPEIVMISPTESRKVKTVP